MIKKTILCDKCKKNITEMIHWRENLCNDNYTLDLCDGCHGEFIKVVGTWIKEKK